MGEPLSELRCVVSLEGKGSPFGLEEGVLELDIY